MTVAIAERARSRLCACVWRRWRGSGDLGSRTPVKPYRIDLRVAVGVGGCLKNPSAYLSGVRRVERVSIAGQLGRGPSGCRLRVALAGCEDTCGVVWCTQVAATSLWVGQIVTFFAYRLPSRPMGSLAPTQPGRVTNPTQGHPEPPWEAPLYYTPHALRQSAGCSGVSPSHRPSTGSCHRARSGSTAGPGQRLPPCMCSGGISGHLLSTSPKRARAI